MRNDNSTHFFISTNLPCAFCSAFSFLSFTCCSSNSISFISTEGSKKKVRRKEREENKTKKVIYHFHTKKKKKKKNNKKNQTAKKKKTYLPTTDSLFLRLQLLCLILVLLRTLDPNQ